MLLRKCGARCPTEKAGDRMRGGVIACVVLLLTCVLMAGAVSADDVSGSSLTTWDAVKTALQNDGEVALTQNIENADSQLVLNDSNQSTLDLNGHTITGNFDGTLIVIGDKGSSDEKKGSLKITGSGTIVNTKGTIQVYHGNLDVESGVNISSTNNIAIRIMGNGSDVADYSVVNISNGAVINGGSVGISINNITSTDTSLKASYGVVLNVDGIVKTTPTDSSLHADGGTIGINVNGQVQKTEGYIPKIIIGPNAQISAVRGTNVTDDSAKDLNKNDGPAVYAAGVAEWTINGGTFTGDEALSIKSGNFTIAGGTFTGNGVYREPPQSWSDGSEATGAAVSISATNGYAQKVNIKITGGTFKSRNQSAFFEGSGTESAGTGLASLSISGGTFETENTSLSPVIVYGSGLVRGGVSITDENGNNLLYRGVNLTNAGTWTGDTDGYTLAISETGNYKLMDDVSLKSMTVSATNTVIDGNGKTIIAVPSTGTSDAVITVSGDGSELKNLKVTTSDSAEFSSDQAGKIVKLSGQGSKLTNSEIDASSAKIITSGKRCSFHTVIVSGENAKVSGSTVLAGAGHYSSSQCIVVLNNTANAAISGVEIINNILTPNTASKYKGASSDNPLSVTSGSIGVRVAQGITSATISDNIITSIVNKDLTSMNNGIAIDDVRNAVTVTANNNKFTLSSGPRTKENDNKKGYVGGFGNAFYVNPGADSLTVTINAEGNTVTGGTYFVYADDDNGNRKILILAGTLKNNNFGAITGKKIDQNDIAWTSFTLTQTDLKWEKNIEPAIPEVPSVTPTKGIDGNSTITPNNNGDTSFDAGSNTAIIGNANSGAAVIHISGDGVTHEPGTGAITAPATAEIKAVYNSAPAAAASSGTGVTYQLNISLKDADALGGLTLPTISPAFDESTASLVISDAPGFTPLAMITATGNLNDFNNRIKGSGIELTFTVPKAAVDAIGLDKIRAFHVKNGKAGEPLPVTITLDGTGNYYLITVIGSSFSTYALAASPASVSASSSGNSENSFRVLFETSGGSFVTPATGLSYGDRIAKPADPVKDGYSFAGWYKDSAGTIAWIFDEDAVPGDISLYAKWVTAGSEVTATEKPTGKASASPTKVQATVSETVSQTASTTQNPVTSATTAPAKISPTMTQAPAPLAGLLFGLLGGCLLIRRRE